MSKLYAFLWKDVLEAASYRFAFLSQFVSVFGLLLIFYFFSRLLDAAFLPGLEAYGGDYFSFVLIGIALANYTMISLTQFGRVLRQSQVQGTLEALLNTQAPLPTVAIAPTLYSFVMGTLHVAAYLLLGAFLFGADFAGANIPGAILVLVLTGMTTAGVGLLAASAIVVIKQGDPVTMVFSNASLLLSGVAYPVTVLPDSLQGLARLFPLTYSLEGMRMALLQGASLGEMWLPLLVLAAFAAVLFPASLMLFQLAVRRARLEGTLGHY